MIRGMVIGKRYAISIPAPTRGATICRGWRSLYRDAISIPAPTRGATLRGAFSDDVCFISIPAPTRGATLRSSNQSATATGISIPAPTRGATCRARRAHCSPCNFNSRPHAGGDRGVGIPYAATYLISIPAPTRGATLLCDLLNRLVKFQFPPPRGGRLPPGTMAQLPPGFQFPPPRGGRLRFDVFDVCFGKFQFPPPRGGRRNYKLFAPRVGLISIPAPTRGATAKIDKKACGFCCKFTKFALRLFKKQEDFSWKSSFYPKRRTFFLTFPAPIARRLVYGWHRRRKTRGYRSKGSPDWIGAVFPSASILFL